MDFRSFSTVTSLLLLVVFLLIASCSGRQTSEEPNPGSTVLAKQEILDRGVVKLKLDLDANFESLQQVRGIQLNGRDLVTFYNRKTNTIFLHDLDSGGLIKKIVMEQEGPNAVKSYFNFGYFFHTPDSIFVNGLPVGLYLINDEGKVLSKRNLGREQEFPSFDSRAPTFDHASRYEDGQISMDTEFRLKVRKEKERVLFDFEEDALKEEFIDTRLIIPDYEEVKKVKGERMKRGEIALNNFRFFSEKAGLLFASTVISDTIYVFREGILTRKIYAGVPGIEVADYASYATVRSMERLKNGMQAIENPKQDPQFKNTLMSPDGRFIYRVFYHGTQPKRVEGLEKPLPGVMGATLVVLHIEKEELLYYELPAEEIELEIPINRHVFVTNRGIYFRVAEQENEDEVLFRLFELKD